MNSVTIVLFVVVVGVSLVSAYLEEQHVEEEFEGFTLPSGNELQRLRYRMSVRRPTDTQPPSPQFEQNSTSSHQTFFVTYSSFLLALSNTLLIFTGTLLCLHGRELFRTTMSSLAFVLTQAAFLNMTIGPFYFHNYSLVSSAPDNTSILVACIFSSMASILAAAFIYELEDKSAFFIGFAIGFLLVSDLFAMTNVESGWLFSAIFMGGVIGMVSLHNSLIVILASTSVAGALLLVLVLNNMYQMITGNMDMMHLFTLGSGQTLFLNFVLSSLFSFLGILFQLLQTEDVCDEELPGEVPPSSDAFEYIPLHS